MKKNVLIAGGGPAGLTLAAKLAQLGHNVTVFEQKSREAAIAHYRWTDSVDLNAFEAAGLDVPTVENDRFVGDCVKKTLPGDGLYLPAILPMGAALGTKPSVPILADRSEQEAAQIRLAEEAGAAIRFSTPVVKLSGQLEGTLEEIAVTGLIAAENGCEVTHCADIVIDATGYASALRKQIALSEIGTAFKNEKNYLTYRAVMRTKGDITGLLRCTHRFENGQGYMWVTPIDRDCIDIGCCCYTDSPLNPAKTLVEETLNRFPENLTGERIYSGAGYIPVEPVSTLLVLNGFAIVGDSAAMAVPTSGCGAAPAMFAALDLAQVIDRADRCTAAELWPYAAHWFHETENTYLRYPEADWKAVETVCKAFPAVWDCEKYSDWLKKYRTIYKCTTA